MCALVQRQPAFHIISASVLLGSQQAKEPEVPPTPLRHDPDQISAEPELEVDVTRYDPPSALDELANITDDTIRFVVEASLERVIQQVEAERRLKDAARFPSTGTQNPDDEVKDKGEALVEGDAQIDDGEETTSLQPETKSRHRSRFGFRRVFERITERGHPSGSSFTLSQLPAHLHNISLPSSAEAVTASPSSFTQLIYKRIKTPSEASSSTGTIECVSCFDDIKPKEGVKTPCHYYCRLCFERLITVAISSEAQWPPKCCLNPIPFRTVTKYVPLDLAKRYRDKDEEFRVPVENRIYCSHPDCGEWIKKFDKALNTARCSKGHYICVLCRGEPHATGAACPQDTDRKLADQLAEEQGWRRCIKCGVLVEHKEACQHMTCRCGAQFCYVCGLVWRTCSCTSEQLASIKQRAVSRRQEREDKQAKEDAWLRNALRLIEEFERETQRKEEEARAAEALRREERRRQRAIERAQREKARLAALDTRYKELGKTLVKIESLQRAFLSCTQSREMEEAIVRAAADWDALVRKHAEERYQLQRKLDGAFEDQTLKWDHEGRLRSAWEKQLEDEYATELQAFWKDKPDGQESARRALQTYMAKNDLCWDGWRRARDQDLEKCRHAAEEETAVREELMEAMRQRLKERLSKQQRDCKARHAAERKWFELVVSERPRLLAEIEVDERQNGGENDAESESDVEG
ncbi:hypothetical protein OQA88_1554 [Cercophora sp. LCS_1]